MGKLHLNNIKLRDKLLLMYLLSVFIPIVVTNVVFYHVTTNNIRNQKIRDANIALEKLQRELRSVIDEAAGISYLYYIDPVLNEHLNRTYESDIEYVEAYNTAMKGVFNKSEQAYGTIASTVIYSDNPTILTSGTILPLTDAVRSADWYAQFRRTSVSYPVLIHSGNDFSFVQRLDYAASGSYTQIVKIDLNMSTVRRLFADSGFEGSVYFVHPDGTVQYTDDREVDWRTGATPMSTVALPEKPIAFSKHYANNNYLNGWSLHGVMDEKAVLQEVRKSSAFVFYMACINFLLPSLIIAAISRSIHVRLVRILRHMKKVKNQHFETIPYEESRDEIGQLTGEFNRMTQRIDSLIHDVYMADIQKKDLEIKRRQAQLQALHSQINPHFLFNALETIRMRSLIKGEAETARTINRLSKIFRKAIVWNRDWVTVREEMELIECFLEIQKYRFGDKLEYRLTVEEAVHDLRIPKMTFLPFVENASIHGIESSPGIGLITVHIGYAAGRLAFRLTDNGVGIPPERLESIVRYLQGGDEMGEHVGMKNAYYRLKLCYKDSFDFAIRSEEGKGTAIEILLPPKPETPVS